MFIKALLYYWTVCFTRYIQELVLLDHPEGAYSGIDVEAVDYDKYPGLAQVEFMHADMQPGDCLYIPYKWYKLTPMNSMSMNSIRVASSHLYSPLVISVSHMLS